jgi:tetratricopeptide (TPR) repeat protein
MIPPSPLALPPKPLALRQDDRFIEAEALRKAGAMQRAWPLYAALLQENPRDQHCLFGAALCYGAVGRLSEAAQAWQDLLAESPDLAYAHDRLGLIFLRQRRYDEAGRCFDRAQALAPAWPDPCHHQGILCQERRCYPQAIGFYRQAMALGGQNNPVLLYHMAKALKDGGALDAALPFYRRALARDPDNPVFAFGHAVLRLMTGAWEEGWAGYERRWTGWDRVGQESRPAADLPFWDGTPPGDEAGLIVFAEQGQGDCLLAFRFLADALRLFRRALLVVPASLQRLLAANAPPGLRVIDNARLAAESRHDAHGRPLYRYAVAMMSLPGLLKAKPNPCFVGAQGYLRPNPDLTAGWRRALDEATPPGPCLRVGLVWRGGSVTAAPARDIALADLLPLLLSGAGDAATLPPILWISLQKYDRPPPRAETALLQRLPLLQPDLGDFAHTAALIEALDLVISVDTAVAHLAGALGKPVWLLNRYESEWRWLRYRNDTPWYQSMRILTQSAPGLWSDAAVQLRPALAEWGQKALEERPAYGGTKPSSVTACDQG